LRLHQPHPSVIYYILTQSVYNKMRETITSNWEHTQNSTTVERPGHRRRTLLPNMWTAALAAVAVYISTFPASCQGFTTRTGGTLFPRRQDGSFTQRLFLRQLQLDQTLSCSYPFLTQPSNLISVSTRSSLVGTISNMNSDITMSSSMCNVQMKLPQPRVPATMFLHPRFGASFSPLLSKTGATIAPGAAGLNQKTSADQRRVLGFDISFPIVSSSSSQTESSSSARAASKSNVNLETWNGPASNQIDFLPPFAGLQWNSNNAEEKSLLVGTITLPAWFPWIPSKSQIQTLKVIELKEACAQRGLRKVRGTIAPYVGLLTCYAANLGQGG
jgi:hypothetical protein